MIASSKASDYDGESYGEGTPQASHPARRPEEGSRGDCECPEGKGRGRQGKDERKKGPNEAFIDAAAFLCVFLTIDEWQAVSALKMALGILDGKPPTEESGRLAIKLRNQSVVDKVGQAVAECR